MIIAIVAAAIVLLAAVGGIIMVLTRGGEEQPGVTITPSQPVPPTEQPTSEPTGESSTAEPQPTPTQTSQRPTAGAIDIGNGVQLKPAGGWQVTKTGENVAQLSDGNSVFLGQSLQISQSTNPGQLCDAWHRDVAEGTSNGKFQDAKDANVGTRSDMCRRGDCQRWPGHDKAVFVLSGIGSAERWRDGDRHGVLHSKCRYRTAEQGLHLHGQLNAGEFGRRGIGGRTFDDRSSQPACQDCHVGSRHAFD
jgi:hypothetical protein